MDMIAGFIQYLEYEKNYSPNTVLSYAADLEQFCEFLGIVNFNPSEISEESIQSWVVFLMDHEFSARSISRKISTLKSFWKYMVRYQGVKNNPTNNIIQPKTKKPLPVFFNERELQQVINNPNVPDEYERVRDILILETMYMTGIRLSELVNLKEEDLDFSRSELRVIGKRNKQRVVPVHPVFGEKIKEFCEMKRSRIPVKNSYLFVRANGEQLYTKLVYNSIKGLLSDVTTKSKRSPHTLRHSFASSMLGEGADINAVKELLGHSSLAATQVYTHTGFGELHNIYKQAHPRAK